MTITQLKYVITVSSSSSMNEAAGKLFISQPSLSAAIKELESEIGIELFRRTNRGDTGGKGIYRICQTDRAAV